MASVAGAFFITAIVVRVNTLIAEAITEKRISFRLLFIAVAAALIIATHAVGYWLLSPPDIDSKPLRVGIVQSDFPLEMKWDREYTVEMVRNTAEKSRALAQAQPLDLIVWPEALITADIDTPEIRAIVSDLARDTGAFIFTGSSREDESGHFMNSSHLITPQGEIAGYYDKVHLAPFGEYVPFGRYFPFIKSVVPTIGDVEPGSELKVFPVDGRKMGPLICFEVLFSNLAEELRSRGADLLVVITNLGWFGESNAIPQEMEIARMRAVETRLPLIHSANTGISGVFDPWGRFQIVNGYFTSGGNFIRFLREAHPDEVLMKRVGGIFDLPAAAPRPIPVLPWLFPWLMLGIGAAVLILAAARRKKAA
jgi:apolipoprotein N-acyltransferase